ncbi:hypothetical protein E6C76_18955 [Pseudothauera nasutitermitis]|uniref:PH domain-containing protein n=1 Tax=Pseudothauera nasutitermitis TaxID=2565930 RepID=A0A4S4ASL4_9RHOO|nr:hypothetical protein [Pseudothauera nasutitermitis]THF62394.1 hypothetical protein E6C76_18955 [Pseudothauera nasutitermitis]
MRLTPDPWRTVLLFSISACFTGLGLYLVMRGEALGWLVAGVFGLFTLMACIALLPGSSYLELGPRGMKVRSLYRAWFVCWKDIDAFFVARVARRPMVCWNYATGPAAGHGARRFSRALTGVEAGLPDTYGHPPEELAALLNDWRARHDRHDPGTPPAPLPACAGFMRKQP